MSSSSFDETLTNSAELQSCSTPAYLVTEKSLHQYLLEPLERKQSPVTRTYFSKKVTFDENTSVTEQLWSDEPQFKRLFHADDVLPWQTLSKTDRTILESACAQLALRKPTEIRITCEELLTETTEDLHPEIFIQRPDLMFHLQDILVSSDNQSVKVLTARLLAKICFKLRKKIEYLRDENNSSSRDNLSTHTQPLDPSLDDDESFADYINTTKLIERQILVHEFCLLCLSNSSSTFCQLTENKALNGISDLFFESLNLFEVVLRSSSSSKWYENNCGHVSKNAREVLDEIARELCQSFQHHRKMSRSSESRFHRIAYLSTLIASVHFLIVIGPELRSKDLGMPSVSFLNRLLGDSLSDETLYLSHKSLHKQVYDLQKEIHTKDASDREKDQPSGRMADSLKMFDSSCMMSFDKVKAALKSLSQAVKVLNDNQRPIDEKLLLESCCEAMLTYNIYENTSIVKLIFSVCKKPQKSLRNLVCKAVLQTLAFPDLQIKTSAYIEIHSLVQMVFGIKQAVHVKGSNISDVMFLINNGAEILEEILQFGMISESDHIRQASEDVILYLLKGEKVMGCEIWGRFLSKVLRPNFPLLDCFASTNLSKSGAFSNDTRSFLGSFIMHAMSPESEKQMFNGITLDDAVCANLRMLFSNDADVRERSLLNLKTLLSKEHDSHSLLPRFSTIVQTDLRDYFVRVEAKIYTRSDSLLVEEEQILLVKSLLDILSSESVDYTMKHAALLRLSVIVQNSQGLQNIAIAQNGFRILYNLIRRCLSEPDADYPVEIIPPVTSIFKSFLLHQADIRFDLSKVNPTDFLLGMLRCAFIFPNDPEVRADISIILFNSLYKMYLKVDVNSSKTILLPRIFHEAKGLPLFCSMMEDTSRHETTQLLNEPNNLPRYLGLIKAFWNFAWYGGPRNTLKHENSITSNMYSARLHLTKEDLDLLRFSFSEFVFEDLPAQLRLSGRHSLFLKKLHFASSHLRLSKDHQDCDSIRYFPLKETFGKFLTSRPVSFSDEKLFVEVIEFLIKISKRSSREASWLNYLIENAISHQSVCLHFLTRKTTACGHDFMVKKGQEKVSELIVSLFLESSSRVQKEMSKDFSNFIVSTKPALNLSLLKVLSQLVPKQSGITEATPLFFCLAQEVEQTTFLKHDILTGSCFYFWLLQALEVLLESDIETAKLDNILNCIKILVQHRNPMLRLASLNCLAAISRKEKGAQLLVPQTMLGKLEENRIWLMLSAIVMDSSESNYVRCQALNVLGNLLALSSDKSWFGPVATEPVSKIFIVGECSLSLFFKQIQFEEFLIDNFRRFSLFHHVPIDDSEEDSMKMSQNSIANSSIPAGRRPTGFLIANLLNFVEKIVALDATATARMGEPVISLPLLFNDLFPVILSLSFDVSDPQSEKMMSVYPNAFDDYVEMFESLSSVLQSFLSLLMEGNILGHLQANNAVYQSMIISSTHHLWKLKKSEVDPCVMMHELAQLLLSEPTPTVTKMLEKFYEALMTMVLYILHQSTAFDQNVQRATAMVAAMHRYILMAEESTTSQSVLRSTRLLDTLAVEVCQKLLLLQLIHREDHNAVQNINVALQHIFPLSVASKNVALNALSPDGLSYFLIIFQELEKSLDFLAVFVSSSSKDESLVLSLWSDVDNFINLANNLCLGSNEIKQAMANAELHKSIVHIFALIFAFGNLSCTQVMKNLLLVILCNTLSLISTLAASSNDVKATLVQNVSPKYSSAPFQNSSPKSVLQTLIGIYCKGKKQNENHPLFKLSTNGKRTYQLIVIPKIFRILTGSLTSNECRSFIIRSGFCSDFQDILDSILKNPTSTFTQNMATLVLDLLLSLTSFPDGQAWFLKQNDLVVALQLVLQSSGPSNQSAFNCQSHLSTLAIIRNISFHPNGRVKLLLDTQLLSHLSKSIGIDSSGTIVLSTIWSLANNNHRAKILLQDCGITRRILEEVHKRESSTAKTSSPDNDDLLRLVKKIISLEN